MGIDYERADGKLDRFTPAQKVEPHHLVDSQSSGWQNGMVDNLGYTDKRIAGRKDWFRTTGWKKWSEKSKHCKQQYRCRKGWNAGKQSDQCRHDAVEPVMGKSASFNADANTDE